MGVFISWDVYTYKFVAKGLKMLMYLLMRGVFVFENHFSFVSPPFPTLVCLPTRVIIWKVKTCLTLQDSLTVSTYQKFSYF